MERLTKCDNCGRICPQSDLNSLVLVHHLASRLDAGAETPAGECRPCGAFAYLIPKEEPCQMTLT